MSTRAFAEHLGVALRTVAKWEKLGPRIVPRPDSQAILDTALVRASPLARARFEDLITDRSRVREGAPRSGLVDHEEWAEDLDRVIACLSRQDFPLALNLVNRWIGHQVPNSLDHAGLYLYGRSMLLLGDLQRDQGVIAGPLSAHHSYSTARRVFVDLAIPRRVAQVDLLLALLSEMSGDLDASVRLYEKLAIDERLSRRDRARARLWEGRAHSKSGRNEHAVDVIASASRDFEDLAEPEDWSVAQQKIALAHRGRGDLSMANRYIEIARSASSTYSPLQRVRLDTAHGHILLSDPATWDAGLAVLDRAAQVAGQYGLGHQLRSICRIRQLGESDGPVGRPVKENA